VIAGIARNCRDRNGQSYRGSTRTDARWRS